MAFIKIPISSTPSKVITVIIDQVSYRLRMDWVEKDESWYMSLYQINGAPIFLSHKVLYNNSINDKYRYIDPAPQGSMMLIDSTNTKLKPDYESISTTDDLYYLSVDGVL